MSWARALMTWTLWFTTTPVRWVDGQRYIFNISLPLSLDRFSNKYCTLTYSILEQLKTINFPFGTNVKVMVLGIPILKHVKGYLE